MALFEKRTGPAEPDRHKLVMDAQLRLYELRNRFGSFRAARAAIDEAFGRNGNQFERALVGAVVGPLATNARVLVHAIEPKADSTVAVRGYLMPETAVPAWSRRYEAETEYPALVRHEVDLGGYPTINLSASLEEADRFAFGQGYDIGNNPANARVTWAMPYPASERARQAVGRFRRLAEPTMY